MLANNKTSKNRNIYISLGPTSPNENSISFEIWTQNTPPKHLLFSFENDKKIKIIIK
jgi:hypothetical protein